MTLVLGSITAALLLLWPAEVTVFGTSASCGPPIAGAFATIEDDGLAAALEHDCRTQSRSRALAGGAVFWVAAAGGGLMLFLPRRP